MALIIDSPLRSLDLEKHRELLLQGQVDDSWPRVVKDPETHKPIILVAPNMTQDGRTVYGFKWRAIRRMAMKWWDRTGRHILRAQHWTDPDEGLPSGLTRGLEAEQLTARELGLLTNVYEEHQVRGRDDVRQAVLEHMVLNHPEYLNQTELAKYLREAPDVDQQAGAMLKR